VSDEPPQGGEPGEPRGPDLARAALARAREQARARGLAARRAPSRRGSALRPARPDDARDPQPFGRTIRELVGERGWETTEKVGMILGRWPELVGPDIAAHCRPETLRDGELVLAAESTAWATQLRLLAPSLLTTLRERVGADIVRRVVVRGPTAPDWRRGPRRVAGGRGPRDTYG
jgi:predicted nucleic acid-binding Zn ribbon protein